MNGQPEIVTRALDWALQARDIALGWLTSPAAWSQFALLAAAYLLARLLTARLRPWAERKLTPKDTARGPVAATLRFALRFLPLLLPLLAYGFTAVGEGLTRAAFGSARSSPSASASSFSLRHWPSCATSSPMPSCASLAAMS